MFKCTYAELCLYCRLGKNTNQKTRNHWVENNKNLEKLQEGNIFLRICNGILTRFLSTIYLYVLSEVRQR